MPSVLSAPQTAPLQHEPGEIASLTRLQEIQGQLRDIHPGPPLESASDPRLLALGLAPTAMRDSSSGQRPLPGRVAQISCTR